MSNKLEIQYTNKFKKQYSKISKRKEFDRENFIKVLELLSNNKILPEKYKNHLLVPKSLRYLGASYSTRHIARI